MIENFNSDIIKAMKEKDQERLMVLRMVKGALQLEKINNKKELTDELFIDVLTKQIKMRNDSINEFQKANRTDLVEKTQKEVDILNEYLPAQLTKEEVDTIIDESFEKLSPSSMKDMGLIMKDVTPKIKGRYNMQEVSTIIKSKLNNL